MRAPVIFFPQYFFFFSFVRSGQLTIEREREREREKERESFFTWWNLFGNAGRSASRSRLFTVNYSTKVSGTFLRSDTRADSSEENTRRGETTEREQASALRYRPCGGTFLGNLAEV